MNHSDHHGCLQTGCEGRCAGPWGRWLMAWRQQVIRGDTDFGDESGARPFRCVSNGSQAAQRTARSLRGHPSALFSPRARTPCLANGRSLCSHKTTAKETGPDRQVDRDWLSQVRASLVDSRARLDLMRMIRSTQDPDDPGARRLAAVPRTGKGCHRGARPARLPSGRSWASQTETGREQALIGPIDSHAAGDGRSCRGTSSPRSPARSSRTLSVLRRLVRRRRSRRPPAPHSRRLRSATVLPSADNGALGAGRVKRP